MKYGKTHKLLEIDPLLGGFMALDVVQGNLPGAAATYAFDKGERVLSGGKKQRMYKLGQSIARSRRPDARTIESSIVLRGKLGESAKGNLNTLGDIQRRAQGSYDPMPETHTGIGVVDWAANRVSSGYNRREERRAMSGDYKKNLGQRISRIEQASKLEDPTQAAKRAETLDKLKTEQVKGTGAAAQKRLGAAKKRLANMQGIAAKNKLAGLTKVDVKPPKYGFGGGALALGAVGGYHALGALTRAGEAVAAGAASTYGQKMGNIQMGMQSASSKQGNLQENKATWATRKTLYGPSGRKSKTWKFNFNEPSHVKRALQIKKDSDLKKLMKSSANITKHVGVTTSGGVPLKYAFRSNDGKNLYAGKTIGMRQHTISQHKQLGLPMPKGYENFSFKQVNDLFKRHNRFGWYKRQYNKAPIHRKVMIGAAKLWKGVKKSLGLGESAIQEEMTFTESAAPVMKECAFMSGAVVSPIECDCVECLSVTRRIRAEAGEPACKEMAETSVPGTMLMDGTQGANPMKTKPKFRGNILKFRKREQGGV